MPEKQSVMNMMRMKSLYVISRSVQSIWIFWHDCTTVQSENLCEICQWIFVRLQTLHSIVDGLCRVTFKQLISSLWRLIRSVCLIHACHKASSFLKISWDIHEIDWHCWTWWTVRAVCWLFIFIICCSYIFFRMQITDESLSQNNVLFMMFQ